MNDAGAVGGQVLHPAVFDKPDQHRPEAVLDGVRAEAQHDRTAGTPRGTHPLRRLAHQCRGLRRELLRRRFRRDGNLRNAQLVLTRRQRLERESGTVKLWVRHERGCPVLG